MTTESSSSAFSGLSPHWRILVVPFRTHSTNPLTFSLPLILRYMPTYLVFPTHHARPYHTICCGSLSDSDGAGEEYGYASGD